MALTFNDLLHLSGVAPAEVTLILHTTTQQPLREMLPHLAQHRRDLFDAYQAVHSDQATATLRNRPLMASFLSLDGGRLLFEGLYRIAAADLVPAGTLYADPAYAELEAGFGAADTAPAVNMAARDAQVRFTFAPDDRMATLRGRVVIGRPAGRAYARVAAQTEAPVRAVLEEPAFDPAPPDWRDMVIPARFLRALPVRWAERLSQWRGVYLIVDQTDGARYVGSAYGAENLLGRWRAHVAGDRGVTAELQHRDPAGFRFSVLDLVAPAAPPAEVIAVEQARKRRLDTVRFGLNRA
jgi:hypothetical protein